jgi:hypothetical protein
MYEAQLNDIRDKRDKMLGAEQRSLRIGEEIGLRKVMASHIRHKFGDVPLPSKVSLGIEGSDGEELLDMTDRI